MDFHDSPEQTVWRSQVRDFLKTELPAEIVGQFSFRAGPEVRDGFERWRQALTSRGWIAPAWPKARVWK